MFTNNSKTLFIGNKVTYLPTCPSTNEEALQSAGRGELSEGGIIITGNQTSGKGQRGNTWESQPGVNLTFSILLKPTFLEISKQFDLNVIISLAILDVLKRYGKGFEVKWPNDIYCENGKICGILVQNFLKGSRIDTSVVGIGLNVNQETFTIATATSLKRVTGRDISLEKIFEELCASIESHYLELRAGKNMHLRQRYLEHLYWFGEDHIFKNEEAFLGRIVGLSPEGKLQIETKQGLKSFGMKEVVYIS